MNTSSNRQEAPASSEKVTIDIEELNRIFTPLSFRERIVTLYEYFEEKEVLMTSAFGTKSVFLLHLISQ